MIIAKGNRLLQIDRKRVVVYVSETIKFGAWRGREGRKFAYEKWDKPKGTPVNRSLDILGLHFWLETGLYTAPTGSDVGVW